MSFTIEGLDWIVRHLFPDLEDAVIVVGDGDAPEAQDDASLSGSQQAKKKVEDVRIEGQIEVDGASVFRVMLLATFGEDEANFEWRERGVETAAGVLIDRKVQDQGRKVQGAIWTVEAALDLVP